MWKILPFCQSFHCLPPSEQNNDYKQLKRLFLRLVFKSVGDKTKSKKGWRWFWIEGLLKILQFFFSNKDVFVKKFVKKRVKAVIPCIVQNLYFELPPEYNKQVLIALKKLIKINPPLNGCKNKTSLIWTNKLSESSCFFLSSSCFIV